MKALIIAAGRGSRMRHKKLPKPLTYIYGLSLIERILLTAKKADIKDFVIVLGYRGEEIKRKLGNGKRYGVNIGYVVNEEWEKGNGVSVLSAKKILKDQNFILLMADHIFNESILKRLMKVRLKGDECALAVDKDIKGEHFNPDDVTKVWINNRRIKKIGKALESYNGVDTGIFLCSSKIFDALKVSISKGKYALSSGNQVLSDWGKLKPVDITGKFWIDVDDKIALKKAKEVLIQHLGKITDGPISRIFNRPLSTRISAFLSRLNITPNQISLISFLTAIVSAIFFSNGRYIYFILGGIFAQLSSILDGCDGEVARLKFQQTKYGGWMDRVLDRYADASIIFGIMYGIWINTGWRGVWILGFITLIGTFMNSYTARWYDSFLRETGNKRVTFRFGRDIRLFIIFIGGVFNQLLPILFILALLTNFESIRRLFLLNRLSKSSE